MCGKNFNAERAARALVEATLWNDEYAAKRFGVTVRSLTNWRHRAQQDPKFRALFEHKLALVDKGWGNEARACLRRMLRKLDELVQDATVEHIHEVAGAVKIVGELEVTRGAIQNEQQPGAAGPDSRHAAAPTQTWCLPEPVAPDNGKPAAGRIHRGNGSGAN